ncbi:MAG: DUF3326 domain-containing protein [Cytophagales bacterium]|nr:DUF3326 domain-containing protein [Cytophagales bacterium]
MIEQEIKIPAIKGHKSLLHYFAHYMEEEWVNEGVPIRFVVTKTDHNHYHCEFAAVSNSLTNNHAAIDSIFRFNKRKVENTNEFNTVLIVPTGIGSEIGGHAGDAGPVSKVMASICDNLLIHPNVVNASDINEMTENTWYIEGSVLTRLLMGTIGLQKVRSNRILMIIDDHKKDIFRNAAVNSVNAARATYGLDCPEIVRLNPPIEMSAEYSKSGRATGKIKGLDNLFKLIDGYKNEFDAIALSSVIRVPLNFHLDYFKSEGEMLNPWGGVEAMLTHTISHLYNLPSAHSPMFETEAIANLDPGVVDSRMAAEAVSLTFLQCILKGLQKSPKIITDKIAVRDKAVLSAKDVSCVVIPDGCIGLPTLAALEQGIPVVAVKSNKNVMKNDLSALPWTSNQLHYADNYLEAIGIMATIKSGITTESVQRPLDSAKVVTKTFESPNDLKVEKESAQLEKV